MSGESGHGHGNQTTAALAIGAIGVVFGDIGTSPLYTMELAFSSEYGLEATPGNVLGVLSLAMWALMLVVSLKYVAIIMRADNRGEGGIMALMALVQRSLPIASQTGYIVGILGIFGAALFFGDGVITPAMTVLSAIEGLEVAAPGVKRFVVPITLVVLLFLFSIQRRGTDKVGKLFGPIMILWFVALAVFGVIGIASNPQVLKALDPSWGVAFFKMHGFKAWLALGAVVLAITGGEALYADMGHFGRRPIQLAWWFVVLPALILNYFGQGALILAHPGKIDKPFFELVPMSQLVGPMVLLATAAAVIASQAVISGAFSVARQAMQLGYLPRLETIHTSAETIGQVFVPWINRFLMLAVIVLVVTFRKSEALASAYGVSVTGTMLIDTLLLGILARAKWDISPRIVAFGVISFLVIDLAFLSSNATKFFAGAWFPLALGLVIFTVMRTWRRGRDLLVKEVRKQSIRIEHFVGTLMQKPPLRVPGTAIFMTASNDYVPMALLHNIKHNKVLHERNLFVTVETVTVPRADDDERALLTPLGHGFSRLTLRFGFQEEPDVPKALSELAHIGLPDDINDATFFASRETVIASPHKGMALWRDKLFAFMARNAVGATNFFRVPGNRLVELGTQVEI